MKNLRFIAVLAFAIACHAATEAERFIRHEPPVLPHPQLTPGAVFDKVTAETVSEPGYTDTARNVPAKLKHEIYHRYGLDWRKARGEWEIDHLVPLCLGGSNETENLWPQKYHINVDGKDIGARAKDALEVRIYLMLKRGEISLADAQKVFSVNWVEGYRKFIGKLPNFDDEAEPETAQRDSDVANPW